MKFSDDNYDFRQIINKLIIIKNKDIGKKFSDELTNTDFDSILTYCYVDEEAGITFECLSNYNNKNGTILHDLRDDSFYKIRFGAVINDDFTIFDKNDTGIKELDNKINMISMHYDKNEDTKELRKCEIFDAFRVKGFPDDIMIYLVKEGLNTEKLYVKLFKIDGQKTFGKLLNEPHQNFGIHLNDIIEILIVQYGGGGHSELVVIHQCD